MKVNFIIVSELASIAQESSNLSIIGIFDTIFTPGFPALQSKLFITTSIVINRDYNHKLVLRKENPIDVTRAILFEQEQRVSVPSESQASQVISSFTDIPFFEEGWHVVELYIDGVLQEQTARVLAKKVTD